MAKLITCFLTTLIVSLLLCGSCLAYSSIQAPEPELKDDRELVRITYVAEGSNNFLSLEGARRASNSHYRFLPRIITINARKQSIHDEISIQADPSKFWLLLNIGLSKSTPLYIINRLLLI